MPRRSPAPWHFSEPPVTHRPLPSWRACPYPFLRARGVGAPSQGVSPASRAMGATARLGPSAGRPWQPVPKSVTPLRAFLERAGCSVPSRPLSRLSCQSSFGLFLVFTGLGGLVSIEGGAKWAFPKLPPHPLTHAPGLCPTQLRSDPFAKGTEHSRP